MSEITVEDPTTTRLARALIVTEIVAQIAATYMIIDMMEHEALSTLVAWHWQQLKDRWQRERRIRTDLAYMMWQAHIVLDEGSRGVV